VLIVMDRSATPADVDRVVEAAEGMGLKEARTAGRLLDKVELYMANSAGENAGRFVITPEDAEALLNGTTPPAKFFVANVLL
jgi:hypothetical protein